MPVDTQHPEYIKRLPQWTKCRDVAAGEDAVKSKSKQYLPKLPGHTDPEYKDYLTRAMYYNATGRTVDGLTGLIFRKDPVIQAPTAMQNILDDVTLDGLTIRDFADNLVEDIITVGRAGILVDFTRLEVEPTSRAEEERLGVRPYVSYYPAESVVNWRTERVSGKLILTTVVLHEVIRSEDADHFEHGTKDQYRALMLDSEGYRQDVWQKIKDASGRESWQIVETVYPLDNNGQRLTKIPFVFVGPRDSSLQTQKPPLYDLVTINLSHYRTMADLENGRHWAGSPTPVFIGSFASEDGDEVTEVRLGSESGIHMAEGSEALFLEFQGTGLTTLENASKQKEEMMAVLGARILAQDKRMVEAAETAQIHRAGESATLASIARSVSQALTRVLEWLRDWSGLAGDVVVELNTDFIPAKIDPQMIAALLQAVQQGRIAASDFVHALQQGEILRDDRTPEDIADEVAMEPPSMMGGLTFDDE